MEPRNHYPPLPRTPTSRAFRLLDLLPGEDSDDIVCHLHTIDPHHAFPDAQFPPYDAVSYAWGERNPEHEILLGAWQVKIRENLFHLLHHLRHRERRVVLWVDALCIDQSSPDERAAQVQMMDRIYRHARRVIVWLGLPLSDGSLAMGLVKAVVAAGSCRDEGIPSSSFDALSRWAHRPYWSRTWVVQEFLLASELVLQCGELVLGWKCVHRFMGIVERDVNDGMDSRLGQLVAFSHSPAYHLMRQRVQDASIGRPLPTLLVLNQHTVCQDPSDKVYAVLGLSRSPRTIRVSYKVDRRRLACDVLRSGEVASKDIVRYASFLSDILSLESRGVYHLTDRSSALYGSKESDMWTIPGFRVGEIISVERFRDNAGNLSAILDRIESSKLNGGFPHATRGEAERLAHLLDKIRLHDRGKDREVLNAISHRSWCNKSITTSAPEVQTPESTSLITVMTSRCVHKEILIGVACGSPRMGDEVLYFLGHPVALTLSPPHANAGHRTISGRLSCLRSSRTSVSRDRVTQKAVQSFTVQSEADLFGLAERTELHVTTMELLMLASGD